jgi:hypothetical protein
LNELRTFHAIYRPLPAGTRVRPTTLNTGYGGAIYLVHDDPVLIKQDRETIREWHQSGMLYQIGYETINEPEKEGEPFTFEEDRPPLPNDKTSGEDFRAVLTAAGIGEQHIASQIKARNWGCPLG